MRFILEYLSNENTIVEWIEKSEKKQNYRSTGAEWG